MGNCSSGPRLKANLRAFMAANPSTDGYSDEWYFDTMNVLLDRWAYSHVQFLRKKFLEATGDREDKELDKQGFFKLFGELQDMPKAVADSSFRMFDTDNSGKLNFREFCCALALCCHLMSSDDETIRFVFDMFDTNDDGLLSANDVHLLLEQALFKDDLKEEGGGGAGEREPAAAAALSLKKQQRIAEIKKDLMDGNAYLTFEGFYEWALHNLNSLHNLLDTFQIVPSPERERAICDEILGRHQTLQEGSTWYCISHKWLQVWKAYVGWMGPSPGRRVPTSFGVHRQMSNAGRDHTASGESWDKDFRDDDSCSEENIAVFHEAGYPNSHHMSARPPEIDNSDLEGEHKGELKMNLVEHLDYELIPEEMWQKLVEWYGGGPAIPRKVICMGQDSQPQVELYPPLVLVVVAGESGQPLPQFSRRFFISRQSSLGEVLQMLAEKLSKPADRSRLWHRAKGEQWMMVPDMVVALDEFLLGKVWDAGAFMLETQTAAGKWPRDGEKDDPGSGAEECHTDRSSHRHFEVGDRVEAQSGVTNQWMQGTIVDVITRDHASAPSQVKVHYDSTVYKNDEWISTSSDRLAPLDTHTASAPSEAKIANSDGQPMVRGATGLQNLGNTCFLNATIQCIANTPLLREYFLSSQYLRDVNDRGMGCKGRLAEEFGTVMTDLWGGKNTALTPRSLKRTIDQFAPQFAGYEQHDAQELLAFFLDGLHEDLNRTPAPNALGSKSGGSSRRDVGTPKLFSRSKPVRTMTGEASPKRGKAAWREKGVETPQSSATAVSPPSHHEPDKAAGNQAALPDHGDPVATKHTLSEGSTMSGAGSTSAPAVAGEIRLSAPAAAGVGRVPRGSAGVGGVSEFPSERSLMRSVEATAAEGAYIDDEDAGGVAKKRSAERPAPPQPAQPRPPSMKNPVIEDDGTQWEDAPLAPTPTGASSAEASTRAEATVTDRSGMKTIEAAETPSNGTSTADMSRESTAERLPRANTAEQLARLNFPRNRFEALLQGGLSLTDSVQVPHPDVATEEPKSKLPAGAAGAAVAAAAAARGGAGGACEGSDDGVFSSSYNESEDFVPELLTPHRASSRRSLNIFSWRRKRSDEDGNIPSSPSTKRRPRTPPTMMPLREEQPQPGDAVTSPTRRMLRGRKASIDGVPLAGAEGAAGHTGAAASGAHSSRTFLPWKGRQMQGPRDGSYDRRDEADNGPAQSVDARGGRAKEKESSWPSFLRRAKSRDSSAPRRTRPVASTRLPPPSHHGDLPIADAGAMVEEHSSNGSRTALRGRWVVSKDTEKSTASPSDEGEESGRLPTDGTTASDVQRAGNSKDSNGQSKAATERSPAASLGFPFLRAPWKSRDPAVAMLGGSNNRKFVDFADATTVAHGGAVVVEHRREWRPDCEASYPSQRDPLPEEARRREGRREGIADCGSSEGSAEARAGEASLPVPPARENTAERSAGTGGSTTNTKEPGPEDKDDNSVESEEIPSKEDTAEDEDHLPDDEKAARQWERYRARNRSLVVDVFEGQLRSQLRCCSCGATSSTFEPFRYLSVPIPSNHVDRATLRVIFFPLPFSRSAGEERQQLTRFSVEVPKSSTVARVEKALSGRLPAPMSSVLLAEVYRSRIHRYLDSTLPLSDVRAEDQLFAFEVLQTPQELVEYQERHAPSRQRPRERGPAGELKKQPQQPRVLLIQAMHRRVVDVCRSDGRTWAQRREVFGLPFIMSAAASWNYATLHDMLMLHARRFLKPYSKRNQRNDHAPAPEERQVPFVARIVNASGTACGACDRRNCTGCLLPKNNSRLRLRAGLFAGATSAAKAYLALDWVDSTVYDQDYVDSVADDMTPPRSVTIDEGDDNGLRLSDAGCNASDEAAGASKAGAGSVPISACVNAFAQPEEMTVEMGNGIHCKKCDKVVDAVKTLEVWREPDVLILHIKRFHFNGTHYEKLNTLVDLPYKELSLRPWIVGPSAATSTPYELYGAVCHWGGMSGGHYTSYCVNGEGKEPVWLKFNDEIVTSVNLSQEREEIARQCYVLFYRKKAFSSSNLINYSSLL